jgi:hypothetical protein
MVIFALLQAVFQCFVIIQVQAQGELENVDSQAKSLIGILQGFMQAQFHHMFDRSLVMLAGILHQAQVQIDEDQILWNCGNGIDSQHFFQNADGLREIPA